MRKIALTLVATSVATTSLGLFMLALAEAPAQRS